MGVKFFADHCVPSSVVNTLQREGFEILILKDYFQRMQPIRWCWKRPVNPGQYCFL